MFDKYKKIGTTLGVISSLFLLSLAVFAFTPPTAPPPEENINPPLNVTDNPQYKEGTLGFGSLIARGVVINPEMDSLLTCNESTRGMVMTDYSGDFDTLMGCSKNASGFYNWVELNRGLGFTITGGNNVYDINVDGTDYRVYEFTSVGTHSLNVLNGNVGNVEVEYLIIGGGGAGGTSSGGQGGGGGGGAGGMLFGKTVLELDSSYEIVVGGGGTAGNIGTAIGGESGDNSSAFGLIAYGGGGGARGWGGNYGLDGGSGGGGGYNGYNDKDSGGAGTPGQGYSGSGVVGDSASGGGGGGAGGPGLPNTGTGGGSGGHGGPGLEHNITGEVVLYAEGGRGGMSGINPPTTIGGGGRGAYAHGTSWIAQNGANGIVIIRHRL